MPGSEPFLLTDDELAYLVRREGGPNPAGLSTRSLGKGLSGEGAIALREKLIAEMNRRSEPRRSWRDMQAEELELSVRTTAILIRNGNPTLGELDAMGPVGWTLLDRLVTKKVAAEIKEVLALCKVQYP